MVTGRARAARSPWLWAGAAAALGLWAPNLIWQAAHHWPVVEMDRHLRMEHSGLGDASKFPGLQILMADPFLAAVWLAGLWALWRSDRFRPYRAFAVAYASIFVFLIVTIADRAYYLASLYTVLLAAGWIVTEEVVRGSRGFFRSRRRRRPILWRSVGAVAAIVAVGSAIGLPLSLPLVPAKALATVPLQTLNYDIGEEIGWQQLVETVARVWRSLPAGERATAVIVAANYGEAGAIDRYGPALGLPGAFSGHNSYWWWGPPTPSLGATVAVGFDASSELLPYFASVTQAATIHNGLGVANDEEGAPVWICRGQRAPWPRIWPQFKDYG
jgi:hypothetical protein